MTVLIKTSTLIGAVILLGATNYSSNSFAHPPDGYGIPEKYRTSEKPQTETVIEPSEADKQQDMAKLSKECKAIMKKINSQSEDDGIGGMKKNDTPEAKKMDAKIKACKAALKNTITDK